MAKEKTFMPQGGAGLIRYFDSTKESIKLKPEHVVAASIGLLVIEIVGKLLI